MDTSRIVRAEWIVESLKAKRLLDYTNFLLYTDQSSVQPKLSFNKLAKDSSSGSGSNKLNGLGKIEGIKSMKNENKEIFSSNEIVTDSSGPRVKCPTDSLISSDLIINNTLSYYKSIQETSSGKPIQETSSGKPTQEKSSGKSVQEINSGKSIQETSSVNSTLEVSSGKSTQETCSGKSMQETYSGKSTPEISSDKSTQETSCNKSTQDTICNKSIQETSCNKSTEEQIRDSRSGIDVPPHASKDTKNTSSDRNRAVPFLGSHSRVSSPLLFTSSGESCDDKTLGSDNRNSENFIIHETNLGAKAKGSEDFDGNRVSLNECSLEISRALLKEENKIYDVSTENMYETYSTLLFADRCK